MLKSLIRRVSTGVVQRFCKPLVGGSNPSPGTIFCNFNAGSQSTFVIRLNRTAMVGR